MKYLLAVCISLCLIAAITPAVSAATMTYTYAPGSASNYPGSITNITVYNIETYYPSYISWITNSTYGGGSAPFTMDNVVTPVSTTFTAAVGATSVGSGTITWTNYTTSFGKLEITFDTFTPGALTGTQDVKLTYSSASLANLAGAGDSASNTALGSSYPIATKPKGTVGYYYRGIYTIDYGVSSIACNFNATPTSGTGPLYVAFQDNSTGYVGTPAYNWSVSPSTGVIGNTSTSAYPTMAFTQNGNFSVTHCISSGGRSDCETKTDYIWVYNSTATATTTFWAVDPSGHRVYDSAISLQDVENTSWTNTSSPSGGVATITSLLGHTINGYATAAGYNNGETLGITADGVTGGIILMAPTNITNVSAGYVTLYVYVKEAVGNAPVSGAYVNIAYASGGSTVNDGGTTSTDGIASFTVPNKTLIYVYGEKAGYNQVSTTKDSGTGSGGSASVSTILYLSRITVTTIPTATTLPGGGTPTTTVTTDPRTSAEKQTDIANILLDYGDELVMFFIVLTILGGVKLIGK